MHMNSAQRTSHLAWGKRSKMSPGEVTNSSAKFHTVGESEPLCYYSLVLSLCVSFWVLPFLAPLTFPDKNQPSILDFPCQPVASTFSPDSSASYREFIFISAQMTPISVSTLGPAWELQSCIHTCCGTALPASSAPHTVSSIPPNQPFLWLLQFCPFLIQRYIHSTVPSRLGIPSCVGPSLTFCSCDTSSLLSLFLLHWVLSLLRWTIHMRRFLSISKLSMCLTLNPLLQYFLPVNLVLKCLENSL